SPTLYKLLTFGMGVSGSWVTLVAGGVMGLVSAAFSLLPASVESPINSALLATFFMALFSDLFRVIMNNQGGVIKNLAKFLFGQTGLSVSGAAIIFGLVIIFLVVRATRGNDIQAVYTRLPRSSRVSLQVVILLALVYVVLVLPQVAGPFIAQV